jgi:hypothetical protein
MTRGTDATAADRLQNDTRKGTLRMATEPDKQSIRENVILSAVSPAARWAWLRTIVTFNRGLWRGRVISLPNLKRVFRRAANVRRVSEPEIAACETMLVAYYRWVTPLRNGGTGGFQMKRDSYRNC